MRSKREKDKELAEENDEREEQQELTEKEQKKLKQKATIEKRKNAKKKDKVARWGGLILLGLVMFIGFLLWVSGEMKGEGNLRNNLPTSQETNTPMRTQQGTVIVR